MLHQQPINVTFHSTELFALCVLIYTLGILYIVFVLQEVGVKKREPPSDINNEVQKGMENPAFVTDGTEMTNRHTNALATTEVLEEKGFLREFFDPTLALELVDVVFKKREGNLRMMVLLVLLCNIVFLASLGENDLTYLYTRLKLNWDGVQFSLHITYSTVVALVGTLLMVGVFSKVMGISDPMIGIVSTICTLISKPVYVSVLKAA